MGKKNSLDKEWASISITTAADDIPLQNGGTPAQKDVPSGPTRVP
jgi:hypothetical protein